MSSRLRLRAFVCDGGVLQEVPDEGLTTLYEIFLRRNPGCRYAIAEEADTVLVIDLYDLRWHDELGEEMRYGAHQRHATYDAAIMASMMTYLFVSQPDKILKLLKTQGDTK